MRTWRWLVLLVVIGFGGTLFAQWAPESHLQITTTQVISADGKVISYEQHREHHYRKADGSMLIQEMPNNGGKTPARAILLDAGKSHRSFTVDYAKGKAIDRHRPAELTLPRTRAFLEGTAPEKKLTEETVNGIRCVIKPVSLVMPDGSFKVIGKVWLAPDYNFLLIKEETMHPLRGGGMMRIKREVHNLTAGAPDEALFGTDRQSIKRANALSGPRGRSH